MIVNPPYWIVNYKAAAIKTGGVVLKNKCHWAAIHFRNIIQTMEGL